MSQHHNKLLQGLGSIAILFHLIAIFSAPASVDPSSQSVRSIWTFCSGYLKATNLNHGYHFFAPEPGSSSTLEYIGFTSEGDRVFGRIPDKQAMQPRLLYHRYFMLTEFLGSFPDSSNDSRKVVIESFAQQIMAWKKFDKVELKLVRHRPATRQEILLGGDLEAPESYESESLGTFAWSK